MPSPATNHDQPCVKSSISNILQPYAPGATDTWNPGRYGANPAGKPLPGLRPRRRGRAHDPDPRRDAAVQAGDHRVQVELGNLGEVFADPGEALKQIGERVLVRGRLAAGPSDEVARLPTGDELVRVDVGERRAAELRLLDQLGNNR